MERKFVVEIKASSELKRVLEELKQLLKRILEIEQYNLCIHTKDQSKRERKEIK